MTAILINPLERTRFFRFMFVGLTGTVIDLVVANILLSLSFPLTLAGTISFIIAVFNNFLWNRYWTYPDSRSKPIFHQLVIFTIVSILGLAIRVPVLYYLEPPVLKLLDHLPFRLPVFTPTFFAHNGILAVAIVMVMFWNFFVNRYVTFNDVKGY